MAANSGVWASSPLLASPKSSRFQPFRAATTPHLPLAKLGYHRRRVRNHCRVQSRGDVAASGSPADLGELLAGGAARSPGRSRSRHLAQHLITPLHLTVLKSCFVRSAWQLAACRPQHMHLQVVSNRVDKPRSIEFKGATDLVTDTDKASEDAVLSVGTSVPYPCMHSRQCLYPSNRAWGWAPSAGLWVQVLRGAFPDHALLGEEGGVSGDTSSPYLWCIDPLDGTTNFAHSYPCFAVSVAGAPSLSSYRTQLESLCFPRRSSDRQHATLLTAWEFIAQCCRAGSRSPEQWWSSRAARARG